MKHAQEQGFQKENHIQTEKSTTRKKRPGHSNHVVQLHQDTSELRAIIKTQMIHHRKRRLVDRSQSCEKVDRKLINDECKLGRRINFEDYVDNNVVNWRDLQAVPNIKQNKEIEFHKLRSNVEVVSWTGDIAIGTPPQHISVKFDTGSSDLVVLSSKCCQSCDTNENKTKYEFEMIEDTLNTGYYNQNQSITYESELFVLNRNESIYHHFFDLDEQSTQGELGRDIVHLTPSLKMVNQTFLQMTKHPSFIHCRNEESRLGLAFGKSPTVQNSLVHNLQNLLDIPIFSMYQYRDNNDDFKEQHKPQQTYIIHDHPEAKESQLILGGVDHNLYEGCLTWHSVFTTGQREGSEYNHANEKANLKNLSAYWDLKLDDVRLDSKSLKNPFHQYEQKSRLQETIARIDSGSANIIAPNFAITSIAEQVGGICIALKSDGSFNEDDVVTCKSNSVIPNIESSVDEKSIDESNHEIAFDIVVVDCSAFFPPLQFIGTSFNNGGKIIYELDKDNLFLPIEDSQDKKTLHRVLEKRKRIKKNSAIAFDGNQGVGPVSDTKVVEEHENLEFCMLRVVPAHDPMSSGWILGDPFLNSFYIAFDIGNRRIGIAEGARKLKHKMISSDICKNDTRVDIMHNEDHMIGKDDSIIIINTSHHSNDSKNFFNDGIYVLLLFAMLLSISVTLTTSFLKWRKKSIYSKEFYEIKENIDMDQSDDTLPSTDIDLDEKFETFV